MILKDQAEKAIALVMTTLLVFTSAAIIISTVPFLAQGDPPFSNNQLVSIDVATDFQNNPSIAVDPSGTIYIAWEDDRLGDLDIYFASSTDGGSSWTTPNEKVNTDPTIQNQGKPSIAADSFGNLYLAWEDLRSGTNWDIYFANSTDGGATWSNPNLIVNNDTSARHQINPSIAVNSIGTVYAVWEDYRSGTDSDIYFAMSTDGGATWTDPNVRIIIDATNATQWFPVIAVDSADNIYVAWQDDRNGNDDIYFAMSSDGGATWTDPNVKVNTDVGTADQRNPTIAVNSTGTIYLAWEEYNSTHWDINFTKSTDGGMIWTNYNTMVNTDGGSENQFNPCIGVDSTDEIYLAWHDYRDSGTDASDIYFANSSDGGASWAHPNLRVNDDTGLNYQFLPTLAVASNGTAYVAWEDDRLGDLDIYFARLDPPIIPTIDRVIISRTPDCSGGWIGDRSYVLDDTDTLYACGWNDTYSEFVSLVNAVWSSNDTGVGQVTTPGTSTIFVGVGEGVCYVTATNASYGSNDTGKLTVLDPTIDYVQIRTQDNGGGLDLCDLVNYPSYERNTVVTFYGAAYNLTVGYMGSVPLTSNWTSNDTNIVTVTDPGNQTTVTCSDTNSGWVWVELNVASIINQTKVTVLAWLVDYIQIRDASGGAGLNLCDPANYTSFPVGHSTTFYGAAYNHSEGFIGDVNASSTWNSTDFGIVDVTLAGSSSTITCSDTNWGTVTITLNDSGKINTTQVTVEKPTIDYIQIRDAADGGGNIVTTATYSVYDTDEFYAAGYNFTAGFVWNVSVSWECDDPGVGQIDTPSGIWTNFTAQWVAANSTCNVTAQYNATISDSTGLLTVLTPITDYVQIRTADNNGGFNLCDPLNYPSYEKGTVVTLYGAAYNLTVGYIDPAPTTSNWTSNDTNIVTVTDPGNKTTVTCNDTNSGWVWVELNVAGITNQTKVTVMAWSIDYVQIRTAPGGGGLNLCEPANYPSYEKGTIIIFYGATYNFTVGYIGSVPLTSVWTSNDTDIVTVTTPTNETTISCVGTNIGWVWVELNVSGITNQTRVTVFTWTVDYIQIRTQPGGGGIDLCDPANYPSYERGTVVTFYGATYNHSAGYLGDVASSSTWDSTDFAIVYVDLTGATSTITCNDTNWGIVTITLDDNGMINTTQVTVIKPTIDYIQIRDAPGGGGNIVTTATYSVEDLDEFYAAGFNHTEGYVEDVSVSWMSDYPDVGEADSPGSWTNFTAQQVIVNRTCTVTANYSIAVGNSTGLLTVLAPTIDFVLIRNASGGEGINLCNSINYQSYPVGHTTSFFGARYNYTLGYYADVSNTANWMSDDTDVITVSPETGNSTTLTCDNRNWGAVTITLTDVDSGKINITQVTVLEPTVDNIKIMDAPGGAGSEMASSEYPVGATDIYYGAYFNDTAGYLGSVPATSTWHSNDTSIVEVTSPGDHTDIVCNTTNYGWVVVTLDDGAGHANTTIITVQKPTVDYIQVRDATGGGGNRLTTATFEQGDTDIYYAAGYNHTAGYIGDVIGTEWNSDVGSFDPGIGAHSVFNATDVDSGIITVSYGDITNSSGSITVIDTTPPAQPAQPTVTPRSPSEVNIVWPPNTDTDLFRYIVQRSTNSDGPWTNITVVEKENNSYNDTGLAPGTTYYYRIIAQDNLVNPSLPSPVVSVTTPQPSEPPEDEFPWILVIIIIIIVVVLIIFLLWWNSRKNEGYEKPV